MTGLTGFDYAVLAIMAISVTLSVIRGLVREAMSLAGWFVAFVAAEYLAAAVAPLMPVGIADPALRVLAGFIIVFVMVLLSMMVLGMLLSALVKSVGLAPIDRVLGAGFGLVRGVAIILTGVLLAGMTTLPKQPVWKQSLLAAPLEALALAVKSWLPGDFARHIQYDR